MSGCISSDSRDAGTATGRTVELPVDDFPALAAALVATLDASVATAPGNAARRDERLHLVFDWRSAPAPDAGQWLTLADDCGSMPAPCPERQPRLERVCRQLAGRWPPRLQGLHRLELDDGRILLSVLHQVPAAIRRRWTSGFGRPRDGAVLVIGAGLAGCALSDALLRRGFAVEVLEAADRVGGVVADLPWLAQHPALSPDRRARLLWQALLTSQRLAARLAPAFVATGRWQPLEAALQATRLANLPAALAHPVAAGERLHTLPAPADGLFLPGCQTADPAVWWQQVRQQPGLTLRTGVRVASLARHEADGLWQARDEVGHVVATAATVVLANAADAFRLAGLPALASGPLRNEPHQVWLGVGKQADEREPGSREPCSGEPRPPERPRLLPVLGGQRGGAAFRIEEPDRHCVIGDDAGHGDAPADDGYRWQRSAPRSRLRLRDNLPMAGAVPDLDPILAGRDRFERDARLRLPAREDLYLLAGLGGRGLLWSIIGAEHIAVLINGEPALLEPDLADAISPDRFIVRTFRRALRGRAAHPPSDS